MLAEQIQALTGKESRCVVLGHLQRGGSPTPYDRILSTRFGAAAVRALHEGITGEMVALSAQSITTVPIAEAVSHLKTIRLHDDLVRTAKGIGVVFGD
jgi:6-phosphofructokinase 1